MPHVQSNLIFVHGHSILQLVKEMVELEGIYLSAFKRIFDIIEDSGWKLSKEEEEEEGAEGEEVVSA